jgi:hypothetical protein
VLSLPFDIPRWWEVFVAVSTALLYGDFWLTQNEQYREFKKVVILEDAESLLMQRGADNQENLSNLLNISDGFLGEMLKLHVICTINCPMDKIDPAILRPGRLLAMREFVRLSPVQAALLAGAKRFSLNEQADYSLAEMYHGRSCPSPRRQFLGFSSKEASSKRC